jgi:hypothetical protein
MRRRARAEINPYEISAEKYELALMGRRHRENKTEAPIATVLLVRYRNGTAMLV